MARGGARKIRPGLFERVLDLPLFVVLVGTFALLMLVPAGYAVWLEDEDTARPFFYAGVLGCFFCVLIGLALRGRGADYGPLGPLLSLLSAYLVLPAFLALPFHEVLGTTRYVNAYIEMVSAITTTGASFFDDPARLNAPLHLWRSLVGWMGGLILWVSAAAVLAPLNLGGVEVTAGAQPGQPGRRLRERSGAEIRSRLLRSIKMLTPTYVALTGFLCFLLLASQDAPLVAICHAMAVLSTSGISPVAGLDGSGSGFAGEALMLLFMAFALSRLTFSSDTGTSDFAGLARDPEVRLGVSLIVIVPLLLFARHFAGAATLDTDAGPAEGLAALWGGLFTVTSFLTTTGFASASWGAAQQWSGLETTGMVLMGLALTGGGVATTAGGLKLLRVFALFANGRRELERLVHPSSVSGAGSLQKRLQRGGAFIAWIFVMLFAFSLAVVCLAFSAYGVPFQNALVLALSGLSTTGPLLTYGGDAPISLAELETGPKAIFAMAMIIGRLETLAIIALFTPDLWRT